MNIVSEQALFEEFLARAKSPADLIVAQVRLTVVLENMYEVVV